MIRPEEDIQNRVNIHNTKCHFQLLVSLVRARTDSFDNLEIIFTENRQRKIESFGPELLGQKKMVQTTKIPVDDIPAGQQTYFFVKIALLYKASDQK